MKSSRNRMKRLVALWHQGKISLLEFSRRANKLTQAKPPINKSLKKNGAIISKSRDHRDRHKPLSSLRYFLALTVYRNNAIIQKRSEQ